MMDYLAGMGGSRGRTTRFATRSRRCCRAHDLDHRVRLAASAFLADQTCIHGEVVPYKVLLDGFTFDGRRVPLLGPQGIFKPAVLPELPLSITTAPVVEGKARPYEDEVDRDGLIIYRYRGADLGSP